MLYLVSLICKNREMEFITLKLLELFLGKQQPGVVTVPHRNFAFYILRDIARPNGAQPRWWRHLSGMISFRSWTPPPPTSALIPLPLDDVINRNQTHVGTCKEQSQNTYRHCVRYSLYTHTQTWTKVTTVCTYKPGLSHSHTDSTWWTHTFSSSCPDAD